MGSLFPWETPGGGTTRCRDSAAPGCPGTARSQRSQGGTGMVGRWCCRRVNMSQVGKPGPGQGFVSGGIVAQDTGWMLWEANLSPVAAQCSGTGPGFGSKAGYRGLWGQGCAALTGATSYIPTRALEMGVLQDQGHQEGWENLWKGVGKEAAALRAAGASQGNRSSVLGAWAEELGHAGRWCWVQDAGAGLVS